MSNKENQLNDKQLNNEEGLQTDFRKSMTYGDYLHLNEILGSQHSLSDHHDEMLFIIIHQASELWMKLILHELSAANAHVRNDDLEPAFKMLSRVSRIQQQLIQSWDVLSTLTPAEYMEFRHQLGYASGFQSYQNRLIEFALGYKKASILEVYQHQPKIYERLESEIHKPSLYDSAILTLSKRGFSIDEDCLERDWSQDYKSNGSVEAAWLKVYQNVDQYWELYELAEKLVDIEHKQQQWRYSHMVTVERIIGHKRGTGGSSGVSYLKGVLDHRFFPELWSLRTQL